MPTPPESVRGEDGKWRVYVAGVYVVRTSPVDSSDYGKPLAGPYPSGFKAGDALAKFPICDFAMSISRFEGDLVVKS
jgi:hypothetical protein